MRSFSAAAVLLAGLLALSPDGGRAQVPEVGGMPLTVVVPAAERFGEKEGSPLVFRAYGTDAETGEETLIGYAFVTSDIPPERKGYSGPIEALVGMDLNGVITGVRVMSYYESYMSQMGDFLRRPGHQEQYVGKAIGDKFLVRGDIDGIARATVSSRALARGVRDVARRVARAYLDRAPPPEGIPDPSKLSWLELLDRDVVQQIVVHEGDDVLAEISLVHLDSPATGEHLVGSEALGMISRSVERKGGNREVMVYGVDGPDTGAFSRRGWSVVQGTDTLPLGDADVFSFGLAGGGMLEDEMATIGGMVLPVGVDPARPFVLQLDLRSEDRDIYSAEYLTLAARAASATAAPEPAPVAEPPAPEPAEAEPAEAEPEVAAPAETVTPPVASEVSEAPVEPEATPEVAAAAAAAPDAATAPMPDVAPTADAAPPAEPAPPQDFDFGPEEEDSLLARTLDGVSWPGTAATVALLLLASVAFVRKREGLRWVTLALTLIYLGFVDGGFLSVSHITSAIWVGASAFLNHLPLLLIATFTVVSTLWFGRVFCGFLCPFGALQDFLTRIVPRRFRVRVPERIHRPALWVKYGILAIILVPAALGIHTSIYPYFEPFGTVFFLSRSWLLWTIAIGFIAASAVIPRFYCRYACPLGAALALGSLVAWKRIERVEHCSHCKVCENACPTGAIRGAEIDFKECVRCNACETLLIEKAGVCQHDLAEVRPRLVQLKMSAERSHGVTPTSS
jgi:ferredoxin